jgi:Lectin C-type domain
MRLARPPHARATARFSLAVCLSCVVSCLPANDLSEYKKARPASSADPASASLEPPLPPGAAGRGGAPSSPVASPGGNGGSSGTSSAAGAGDSEGNFPVLSSPDAGGSASVDDPDATGACAVNELEGPNGHCYFFEAGRASSNAARSACQARGAGWDLASVRSPEESTFLGDHLAVEAWIGASFSVPTGNWIWVVDNQPFWVGDSITGHALGGAYVNWNATEPNGGDALNCVRTLPRSFGSRNPDAPWADLGCDAPRAAICEAFPTP